MTRSRGIGLLGLATAVALALIALGMRSIGIAESSRLVAPVAAIPVFMVGVWLPLLALIYAVSRRRTAVVALAFLLGLSTNLIFLTQAVPAAALTDNSSIFTFKNSSTFRPPDIDMPQNYTPAGSTAATCPAADGSNWTCQFTSDQFTATQTLQAGTAVADLYLDNSGALPAFRSGAATFTGGSGSQSNIGLTKPSGIANGDVLIAHVSVRGDVHTTLAGPSGWTAVDLINQSTTITLGVFWHAVANAGTEPASYTFTWTGSYSTAGTIMTFQNVDNANPVDGHAGNPETGSTTTKTAPAVTTSFANELQVLSFIQADNLYCNYFISPDFYFSQGAGGVSSGSNRTSIQSEYATKTLGAAGNTNAEANGNCTATPGVSHQLTLKQASTPRTCNLTVSLNVVRPITFVNKTTATMNPGPSLQISTPTSTAQNDVMIASMAYTQGATVTAPSGWLTTSTFCQGTTFCLTSYYLVAPASPPASYTWTIGTSATVGVGTISSYRYVDPANPVETYFSSSPPNGTQHATGTGNAGSSNELIYAVFAVAPTTSTATWTEPAGMTERVDTAINASPAFFSIETADLIRSQTGSYGPYTATSSVAGVGLTKVIQLVPAAPTSLGSATAAVVSPSGPTLVSTAISTSAWTFLDGDQLAVDVVAPNDSANCGARLSYDSTATPSKLTVATAVPENVGGALLLAPALPLGARWWKRRRP